MFRSVHDACRSKVLNLLQLQTRRFPADGIFPYSGADPLGPFKYKFAPPSVQHRFLYIYQRHRTLPKRQSPLLSCRPARFVFRSKTGSEKTKTTVSNTPNISSISSTKDIFNTVVSELSEIIPFFGMFLWRLIIAYGMVYVFCEYGLEITICEGPSMMPTFQPLGDEIVLLDRCTPRLWGLQGGCIGTKRAELSRQLQREYVTKKSETQNEKVEESSSSPKSRKRQSPLQSSQKQIWYEPRIPVNRLPSEGSWKRLWTQFTTGIGVGDVVVLQHPDRDGTVCKRVLGLPGDTVTKPSSRRGAEQLHGNHSSSSSKNSPLLPLQTNIAVLKRRRSAAVIEVPDGHIWVEGDNPWNSTDSRNYGPLPASLIVGRVFCRIWPLRGNAMIQRGDRPEHTNEDGFDNNNRSGNRMWQKPSLAFSGSIVFPAGYIDQIIIRDYQQWIEEDRKLCRPSAR